MSHAPRSLSPAASAPRITSERRLGADQDASAPARMREPIPPRSSELSGPQPRASEASGPLPRASEASGPPSRASDEMVALYYDTLRNLAASTLSRSASARSLPPTALVHEAWLRLCRDAPRGWESQRHFLGVATRAMREILIERERARRALRRGGGWARIELEESTAAVDPRAPDWIALAEALERLESHDARKSEVVHLRFFAGLTIDETARALGVSTATVERDWEFAKAWLHRELAGRALEDLP